MKNIIFFFSILTSFQLYSQYNINTDYKIKGKLGVGTEIPKEQFQLGDRWTFHNGGTKFIGYNVYYDGLDKRIFPGGASQIRFNSNGNIVFHTIGEDAFLDPTHGTEIEKSIINFNLGLVIHNSGNIGIGTESPGALLHLLKNDPSIIMEDNASGQGSPFTGTIQIIAKNGTARVVSDKSVAVFLDSDNNDQDGNNSFLVCSNIPGNIGEIKKSIFKIQDNGDTYISGKMAIGEVSTPGNYSLYVEKGILTEKIRVSLKNSSEWADYVFNNDYKLMPIKDLEEFININRHLPNIPSSEEVKVQGIDLSEMNIKLLEKIEELTLYIIALEKRVADLENNKKQ